MLFKKTKSFSIGKGHGHFISCIAAVFFTAFMSLGLAGIHVLSVDALYNQQRLFEMMILACTGVFFGFSSLSLDLPKIWVRLSIIFSLVLAARYFFFGAVYALDEILIYVLMMAFVCYHGRYTPLGCFHKINLVLFVLLGANLILFLMALVDGSVLAHSLWQLPNYNKRIFDSLMLILFFLMEHYRSVCAQARHRNVLAVAVFLLVLALMFDSGRSALLGVLVGALVASWLEHKRVWHPRQAIFLLALLTYGGYVAAHHVLTPDFDLVSLKHSDSSGRNIIWAQAVHQWLQNPIWGHEMRNSVSGLPYWQVYHPHNLPLQLLSEYGVLGAVMLAGWVFIGISIFCGIRHRAPILAGGLVAIGLDGLFSGMWVYPDTQMMLAWYMAFAMAHLKLNHPETSNPWQNRSGKFHAMAGRFFMAGLIWVSGAKLISLHLEDFSCENCTSASGGYPAPRFWHDGQAVHLRPITERQP